MEDAVREEEEEGAAEKELAEEEDDPGLIQPPEEDASYVDGASTSMAAVAGPGDIAEDMGDEEKEDAEEDVLAEPWLQHEALCVADDVCPLERQVITANLSVLGMTPSRQHAYLRLEVKEAGLTSIDEVRGFQHLQFLNLSGNQLRSLEPLGVLRNLLKLNASHNLLMRTQTFTAPEQLEVVDMSYNVITEVGDWGVHKYLRELNLRGNKITEIGTGLQANAELRILDLAENGISALDAHLEGLGLRALSMANNQISSLEGVVTLAKLEVLDMQKNQVSSLMPLAMQGTPRLRKLYASHNLLPTMAEVEALQGLGYLCDLFLAGNPLETLTQYRAQVLHRLPQLRLLDEQIVTAEEKVKAEVMYGSDVERSKEVFLSFLPDEPFIDRRLVKH